jgi:alpha-1,2-mannosyltransferase
VPRASQTFRWLWSLLIAHIAIGTAIWFTSSGAETVWFHVGRWLLGVQDSDSWKPIEIAYRTMTDGSVYERVFFEQGVKLQYPLTAVTLFGGISRASLNVISWCAVAVTAVACALLVQAGSGAELSSAPERRLSRTASGCLGAIAALTFYPVVKAYSLGQVQTCVTALGAVMLLSWQRRRPAAAGLATGAMLLIKPTYAPLLFWGMVRREWRFVAAASAVVAVGVAVSLLEFPLTEQLAYLDVLAFIGRRGELFHANQSPNGLLNRLVSQESSLVWNSAAFADPHAAVSIATTMAAIALLGVSLLFPRTSTARTIDASSIALACTMASPVAWEHHYGVLAPILAATAPVILATAPAGRFTAVVLFAAALVAANLLQFVNRFDGTALNPLQSYLLAAALVIWILLLLTARSCAHRRPSSAGSTLRHERPAAASS